MVQRAFGMKRSFTDYVLAFLGVGIVVFTVAVLAIFATTGMEPSTLVASVFAFVTAEAAICWQIYAKKRNVSIHTDTTGDIAGDILEGLDIESDINDEEAVG